MPLTVVHPTSADGTFSSAGTTAWNEAHGVTGELPLANGGTAAALVDPNADRILFWDDSAGTFTWLTAGSGLTISGTTITASSVYPDFMWFGDGSDGDVTVSSGTTTLARDMYYNDLTIDSTGSIDNGGYRIFVNGVLDLTSAPANAITTASAAGNNSSGTAGATAATAYQPNTVLGSAPTVGAGANGGTAGGANGAAVGVSQQGQLGGQGGVGGAGGNGTSGNGGTAGTMGAFTKSSQRRPWIEGKVSGGGGSSGGGGGGDGTAGGGSGSPGQGSRGIQIFAKEINRGGSTAAGAITSTPNNGGNGFTPAAGNRGGGGGAGGGGGGYIYIITKTLSGSAATNALRASGGSGGNGGTGSGTGTNGAGGTGGSGGRILVIDLTAETVTETDQTGTAGSGPTGATGGAGATCQSNL